MSDIPVTVDFERGYGESLGALEASFSQLFATCAVGCNLEDGEHDSTGIRSVQDQFGRIKAARELANASSPGFFINARTDLFLQAPSERHGNQELVSQAIERGQAYQKAGADGFFVPGLTSSSVLRTLVDAVELPINVMAEDEALDGYVEAGVARITPNYPEATPRTSTRSSARSPMRDATRSTRRRRRAPRRPRPGPPVRR